MGRLVHDQRARSKLDPKCIYFRLFGSIIIRKSVVSLFVGVGRLEAASAPTHFSWQGEFPFFPYLTKRV
jgi:hypothetical protein